MQVRTAIRSAGWWAVAAGTVLTAGMAPLILSSTAQAAVQLDRTRVIVSQKDNKQSVRASNRGKAPVLLQVWVEEGEAARQANAANRQRGLTLADSVAAQAVPFIIDPPVVRLKPDETRALQVWLTEPPETLPKDRESQFWLNVLEVPAVQSAEAQQNRLDISILTRIKVFYRPEAIAVHKWSEKDWLHFKVEKDEQNQNWLIIHNPAPVHRTINKAELHQDDDDPIELKEVPMIPPFEKQKIKLQDIPDTNNLRLIVTSLNDLGQPVKTRHPL